jgi:hypothetical protein
VPHQYRGVPVVLKHLLPPFAGIRDLVDAGALTSYSARQADLYRETAVFVDKILASRVAQLRRRVDSSKNRRDDTPPLPIEQRIRWYTLTCPMYTARAAVAPTDALHGAALAR